MNDNGVMHPEEAAWIFVDAIIEQEMRLTTFYMKNPDLYRTMLTLQEQEVKLRKLNELIRKHNARKGNRKPQ